MKKLSSQITIELLSALLDKTSPSALAFWVTPNTILTLSGARAYCDGVFYHNSKKVLNEWVQEIKTTIKIIESITDVNYAQAELSESMTKEIYAGYNLVLTQGLRHVLGQTKFINESDYLNIQKNKGKDIIKELIQLLRKNNELDGLSKENYHHVAIGILLGYPDKAIINSVMAWNQNDPFAEPLIDADIRGAKYYNCPQPIYEYPRHLISDKQINNHEQLWSSILKDFYTSEFHKYLVSDPGFQAKLKQLKLLS